MSTAVDFVLNRSNLLGKALCGAQFNQHVYAALSGVPENQLPDFEDKVARLGPQLVRLFYNDAQASRSPDQRASFFRAVELAERVGAEINITWQSGGWDRPNESMARFAEVLDELVARRRLRRVRWVTIQNEPNSPTAVNITPERNKAMYRALDERLRERGLKPFLRYMVGDLLEHDQEHWFQYLAAHLTDIAAAYSVHIYWDYWDTAKFQRRLADVQRIVRALPVAARKPVYVTEYGVRGIGRPDPGSYRDGTPLKRSNIMAFQHAWFQIVAAGLGYVGTSKWDCYFGKYDKTYELEFYAIGTWEDGWPLYPTYHVLRLFMRMTKPTWRLVSQEPREGSARGKRLAAFRGPGGTMTLFGLADAGGALNTVSRSSTSFVIAGLRPGASFTLVLWNSRGDGANRIMGPVHADRAGVVRLSLPVHAVFGLTSEPRLADAASSAL